MTEEIKNKPQISILYFVWLAAVSAFCVSIGLKLSEMNGYIILFNRIQYDGLREMILKLSAECAADVASFLIITIASRPYASTAASSVIIALRGFSIGTCASFCAENAVSAASVAVIISYAMVSFLMMLYSVFVSRVDCGWQMRLLAYLLVTGTAALLRVLPMLLI